jgi:hypothetical protein
MAAETTEIQSQYIRAKYDLTLISDSIKQYMETAPAPDAASLEDIVNGNFSDYLKNMNIKDPWNNMYLYKKIDNTKFLVGCAGSNGEFVNWEQSGSYSFNSLDGQDMIISESAIIYCFDETNEP